MAAPAHNPGLDPSNEPPIARYLDHPLPSIFDPTDAARPRSGQKAAARAGLAQTDPSLFGRKNLDVTTPHKFADGTVAYAHAEHYARSSPELQALVRQFGTMTRWKLLRKQRPRFLDHFNKPGSGVGEPPKEEAKEEAKPKPPAGLPHSQSEPTLKPPPPSHEKMRSTGGSSGKPFRPKKAAELASTGDKWRAPPGWDNFIARQRNFVQDMTECITKEQLDRIAKAREDAASIGIDLGRNGIPGFKIMLKHRFGSVIRGWRFGLDVHGQGKLSFTEFSQACRDIGFDGNMQLLWEQLDADKSGVVTMEELDHDAYYCMEEFRQRCRDKYGNTLKAWKYALDINGNDRVEIDELEEVCKKVGFPGDKFGSPGDQGRVLETNARLEQAEKDAADRIAAATANVERANTLLEKAEEAAKGPPPKKGEEAPETVEDAKWRVDKYKAELELAEKEEPPKVKAAKDAVPQAAKYESEMIEKLWHWLLPEAGRPFLSIEDFDKQAYIARFRGDTEMITVLHAPKAHKKIDDHEVLDEWKSKLKKKKTKPRKKLQDQAKGRNYDWNLYLSLEQIKRIEVKRMKQLAKDVGPKNLAQFKIHLCNRYGSMYLAWRYGLDTSGDGRLSFQEFCAAARANDFRGSLLPVWRELDDDNSGVVSLREFDAEAADAIDMMHKLLLERYGNLLEAWKFGLDVDGNLRLDEHEWLDRMRDLGFQGDAKYLFHLLKPSERIFMTIDDFDLKASEAMNRGDTKMMTVNHVRENPMAMTFNERNENMFAVKWRRELADMKIEKIDSRDKAATAMDIGAKTVDAFKHLLLRRFGCMYRAWRFGLDTSGDGKLSFTEFTDAVRAVGYAGSVRKLWAQLDEDGSGVITLDELDPPTFHLINRWYDAVQEKFDGNMIRCWYDCIDTKKKNNVKFDEFVEVVTEANLISRKDAKKIFYEFLTDQSVPKLTLEQIDQVAADCYKRGDYKMLTAKRGVASPGTTSDASGALHPGMTFLERQSTHKGKLWQMDMAQQQIAKKEEHEKYKRRKNIGAQTLKAFKALLKTKYGSILVAWRRALDVSGDGKLSFIEFTAACRAIGYAGSIQKLWNELDDDGSGVISLHELDPYSDECLQAFFRLVYEKYGDMYNAWCKFFEPAQTGQLELYKFIKKCEKLGYTHTHPRNLVKALVPSDRAAYITLKDLDKSAYERLLQDYNKAAELEALKQEQKKKLLGAQTQEGFKKALIHRYGNIARAWRDGLDVSGDGKLSFTEFTTACRDNVGYVGSIKALWKEFLGGDLHGVITLPDIDKETHVTMTSFRELLEQRFGNTLQAWIQALDLDKNGRLEPDEFVERCKALGYEGNAEKLYDMLLREKGSKFLTLYDIDKRAFKALDAGDYDMIATKERPPPSSLTFDERQEQHRSAVIRRIVGKDVRENVIEFWEQQKAKDLAGKDINGLLWQLRHRYGSTVAGWTLGLDRIGSGRLSWQMFCKGCRGVGFIGDLKACWKILDDDDSGTVTLMELDPAAGYALKEFRDMMAAKFSTLIEAWDVISNGLTNCDIDTFAKSMDKLGYHRDGRKLFRWLKIERSNKCLLRPDIGIVERIFPKEKPHPWHPRWEDEHAHKSTVAEEEDIVRRRTMIEGACDSEGRAREEREARKTLKSPPSSPAKSERSGSPLEKSERSGSPKANDPPAVGEFKPGTPQPAAGS